MRRIFALLLFVLSLAPTLALAEDQPKLSPKKDRAIIVFDVADADYIEWKVLAQRLEDDPEWAAIKATNPDKFKKRVDFFHWQYNQPNFYALSFYAEVDGHKKFSTIDGDAYFDSVTGRRWLTGYVPVGELTLQTFMVQGAWHLILDAQTLKLHVSEGEVVYVGTLIPSADRATVFQAVKDGKMLRSSSIPQVLSGQSLKGFVPAKEEDERFAAATIFLKTLQPYLSVRPASVTLSSFVFKK